MSETSIRTIADLARAGFEIARQSLTQVDYEVHHVAARPGYLHELALSPDSVFVETLCSAANGGGVVIGTRTRAATEGPSQDPAEGPRGGARPEPLAEGWLFRDTALPNPTFIYESARTFEGLVVIDRLAAEAQDWHGIAVRDLTKEISEVATRVAGAPLLTLQCPAQLPTVVKTRGHDLRTRKESPSPCSSLAVRFSIALPDASAERRLELGDRLRALCEDYGFGFWIADTRPGHRPGNWFEVCRDVRRTGPATGSKPMSTCLPLTCAGPARIGSTHAIIAFLQRYPQVGVAGCTGTSLDDLAFIHFQLSVEGVTADRLNKILTKLLSADTVPSRPHELLRKLFFRLGLHAIPDEPADRDRTHPASDYQTFLGPAFDYRPPVAGEIMAVWVSWRIAFSGDGLAAPLDCLHGALREVLGEDAAAVSVEYLICRATEQSVVRAKGKLGVPRAVVERFGGTGVERGESRMCALLEDAWKHQADQSEVDGIAELTVAWREAWLGHWTYS
ncbi:hypothetical protein [Amycolatopsis magusensis]|uniref:hypothetical protein n=1 Tax=Amycolatopsis magusensis TaxID=882444 RepID=UPI0037B6D558